TEVAVAVNATTISAPSPYRSSAPRRVAGTSLTLGLRSPSGLLPARHPASPEWAAPESSGWLALWRPRESSGCQPSLDRPQPRLGRLALLEPHRQRPDEVSERAPIAGQGGDRHPLLRPVVPAADRAELDRGDPGREERRGVR